MVVCIDEIKTVVSLQLGIKAINSDDLIIETLGAESADVMNIIVALEEKYQVLIDEGDLIHVRTVADLFHLVQRLQSALGQHDADA
jgi:acyl carrier protein